jgi:hypothetical protein
VKPSDPGLFPFFINLRDYRFMGENTRLLYDLMHYLEENDMDGLLLLVDFEKSFGSIEWKFLRKALRVSLIIQPKTCLNLFAIAAEAIFKSVFSKLIGCQLLIYRPSLLSLGIQVITPRV